MATCPTCGKPMLTEWPHVHPKPKPIIEGQAFLDWLNGPGDAPLPASSEATA